MARGGIAFLVHEARMRFSGKKLSWAAVVIVAGVVACGELSDSGTGPTQRVGPKGGPMRVEASAPTPGTCTTLDALIAQINVVFGAGSPNANSAIGKINNIQHQIDIGNIATAKEHAFALVDFILDKNKTGGLPGTSDQITTLINNVLCFSGLGIVITDPSNTFLVYPSDLPQTLVSSDGNAGTSLPGNPVTEPTLIAFHDITGTFPPGGGPLHTKLDQYAGFVGLTHASENNTGFTQPVIVGVCAVPGLPNFLRARLRLGHDAAAGFEVTPPADAGFLHCPTGLASAQPKGLLHSLASLVLPKTLWARQDDTPFSGGVGGTAGEYSNFGPVDPELSFSGGVGGTAGEYIRTLGTMRRSSSGFGNLLSGSGCDPIEAPIGTPVDAACLPFVTIKTNLGTVMSGVPVSWAVTAGDGVIAPRSGGVCGLFASTASTTSAITGKTGVCWTLGNAGTNSIVAAPSLGGDATPGVIFNPTSFTFNAIANPPVTVVFDQQPPSTITAGNTFGAKVKIVDKHGNQVLGANNAISLALNQFSFANATTSVSANAVSGLATFTGLQINKAATGYTLTANGSFIVSPYTAVASNTFAVVAGPAYAMSIVAGNNQTAAAGSVLPVNPTVKVTDQFTNPISGANIDWLAGGSTGSSVSPATSATNASGNASTSWTIGDGANELTASVSGSPTISQLFSATGTSTLVTLNQCAPGGSGDPINDPNKTFAFYIPNPGNNKTIKEIQLYISSSGRANSPTPYVLRLTTQLGTFDPAVSVPVATNASVFLRGNNSESKLVTFKLTTPIVGSGNGPDIMLKLAVTSNPDNVTINFNSGPCSPGSNCKPPQTCKATEVNSLTPYPAGTTYRKSVAITVKGS